MALLALHWPELRERYQLDSNLEKWKKMPVHEKLRFLTESYVFANKQAKDNPEFAKRSRELFASMESAFVQGMVDYPGIKKA